MNLYFNTDSLNFVNSPIDFSPVSNVSFIFGSSQQIGVTLVNVANNGAYVLPSGYNMVLGLKPVGTYLSGNYLAYGATNVVPDTGNGYYSYQITGFNLYTTGISGLLAENSSITLAMELEYDFNGSGVVLSNPNSCTINNSYINLDQTPFITGALAAYPAPNNVQTITNLGVTYVGTNQTGLFYPASNPSGFVQANETGTLYPSSNPSGFIPASNLIALSGVSIIPSGDYLVFSGVPEFQGPYTGTMTSGHFTFTNGAIATSSHFSLSHRCTSTGNFGALFVSALSAGSVTVTSTNAADSDSISILFR